MSMKQTFYRSVAVTGLAGLLGAAPAQLNAQSTIAINNDDIGGVVTGPNGPEAGVWVIAETTDLDTKFAKMVVTDDQGRYVVPDLPKAKYKIWVRGYGLVDFAEGRRRARQAPQPDRRKGADRGGRGRILSGDLLVFDDQGSRPGVVPRHRTDRQRHQPRHEEPGPVPRCSQDQWLHHVPPARQQGDAHDP